MQQNDSCQVYISIRRTVDWEDEEAFYAQLGSDMRPRVDTWNRVFDMPYHLFRYQLRQIAAENLTRVRNVEIRQVSDVPDGALVVMIDDDDWLAPHLADTLMREWQEGKVSYRWRLYRLSIPKQKFFGFRRVVIRALGRANNRYYIFQTNNYAFVKGAVPVNKVRYHSVADRYLEEYPDKVKVLDPCLSLWNRSIASMTSLGYRKGVLTDRRLQNNFVLFRELYAGTDLQAPEWSEPYVRKMQELMEELRPR